MNSRSALLRLKIGHVSPPGRGSGFCANAYSYFYSWDFTSDKFVLGRECLNDVHKY